ncbi:MAG: zf-TFIIB domain-containing protein [Sphingorhabdus sp.]
MNAAAGMPCPVCKIPLVMSDRQGVEIDYCPQCRGVWLDRGELDKIIERSSQEIAPAPQPIAAQRPVHGYVQEPQSHGHGYGQPYKKRKKSFFEELFD